ncbi:MAG: ATP-binding cassette domain-containing protein [Bacteroidales bacterium]|nr:ATP-binding cassette domain-containing protein [Bacteroidales bacterium]
MIEARNINKSFGENHVLKDVCVKFHPGQTNLVIGQSGSGKTVLIKCLVGLHEIDSGEILYNDRVFSDMSFRKKKSIRKEIGMLFQGGALFDYMNVEQNVMFPLNMFSEDTLAERLKRVNFCLDRVNLPKANKLMPSELSGGMIKRVAIARAIALNPKYLFCDEPNSGLDPQTSNVIDNLISEITKEYKITTVVNTHDMNSVMEIGDSISFIYKGQLWWEGSKEEIMKTGNKEIDEFVFSSELTRKLKWT